MLTIEKPPLKTFRIDFKFIKPEKISFDMMAKVEALLKKDYPSIPSLDIIEYPYDVQIKVKVPIQIAPLRFLNEEKKAQVQLFSDGLIFIFTEYTHWADIKDQIVETVLKSCKILNLDEIQQFRMEYIDEFIFPKNDFNLKNYFKLNLNKPKGWDINFNDFHIGITIKDQETDKFIIRLRGLPNKEKENNLFRLESIYIKKSVFSLDKKQELISELNKIHEIIIDYFYNILSDNLKYNLGVKKVD
ncbi:hypothetical protein LCGC14_1352420 [marine sediment metagenome]|uniref:TIGR04255 family protein n=1 Tax=marine sediment metagenome TaxID=412755 RepID=A0A0F9KWM2_9ZZZZ